VDKALLNISVILLFLSFSKSNENQKTITFLFSYILKFGKFLKERVNIKNNMNNFEKYIFESN
jgi:hypothetical protein